MPIQSGTHAIGPNNGTLTLKTYKEGAGGALGHNLVLQASRWSGTANIDSANPSASSVTLNVEPGSLEVMEGSGGMKPLSDKDRNDIKKNIFEKVLNTSRHPQITFQSTSVSGYDPQYSVQGNLTIMGSTQPVTVAISAGSDGTVTGDATVVQSRHGIKPFSAMLGALKVKDAVDMHIEVHLPTE
ncbi:MAG: YceI family protein [Acidimicrobiales bacterium]